MGKHKANKTRANSVKKMISASHPGLKANKAKNDKKGSAAAAAAGPRHQQQVPTSMFFAHNTALGPPYHVIVDTNFINFAIKNKIELVRGMMDCLLAKCIPVVLDSVMAELEKLGHRYRLALRLAKDPRIMRMKSYLKSGTYADDDIVEHVRMHRCFIVATCDKDLQRRIRKIPGVPIMYVQNRKFTIERMPEAFGAPR